MTATSTIHRVTGSQRNTLTCIVLTIVTLGIYPLYWYYKVHTELKLHSGAGLGGGVALLLGLFVGIVLPFITAGEVAGLYTRRGQTSPVSAVTGLWILLPAVGPIVWFVKTNGALNHYWAEIGA